MTTRIPSSLKWLVVKYQDTQNELTITANKLEKLIQDKGRLYNLLCSLEKVLAAHEISINAKEIPKKQKYDKNTRLKYGAVTKSIYKFLALPMNIAGASGTSITDFVICDLNLSISSDKEYAKFRRKLLHRLKRMNRHGKLSRVVYGKAKKIDPVYKL